MNPSLAPDQARFLDISFDPIDEESAIARIETYAEMMAFRYVVTPNVDHAVTINSESTSSDILKSAYESAAMTLCDSRILALLAKRAGFNLPVVPGSDLTRSLIIQGGPWRRMAVIGGNMVIHANLREKFPEYDWLFHVPPKGVLQDSAARETIARFVETAQADLTFFAIGAPQSELCCLEIYQRGLARGVALCTGASLEFLTGAKRRAPAWMQKAHLEWFHRLASEPTRLWRRYLIQGPRIFVIWKRSRRDQFRS